MESSQLCTRARTVTWADVSCSKTDQQRPRTASDPRTSCITIGIHAHLLHGSILDESREETCQGKNLIENLSFNIGRLVPSPPPPPQKGYFKQRAEKGPKLAGSNFLILQQNNQGFKANDQLYKITVYKVCLHMSCSLLTYELQFANTNPAVIALSQNQIEYFNRYI